MMCNPGRFMPLAGTDRKGGLLWFQAAKPDESRIKGIINEELDIVSLGS